MKILGYEITLKKASPVPVTENRGGWWPLIRESYAGAWQHNVTVDRDTVLSYHAVYACITLIASDIAKLRVKLVEQDSNGIWAEVNSPSFSPVLRKPNSYQTRIQFWESWMLSKLTRGNAYILKERDARGVVRALYVLAPDRVKPMVADDGSVFYQLATDNMAGGNIMEDVMVPASEIIHDRFNCLYHPLIGTSPIFAAGVPATQGVNIQNNSTMFFGNQSRPSGLLIAPGAISDTNAERLKTAWQTGFSGDNAGKVAILSDGMTYTPITITAEDSQLIEQLKWTAEVVCSTFHVPPYKIGVGQMPTYNNIQSLNVEYYSQALQRLMEDAELCLDEGLGIGMGHTVEGKTYGTEFDVFNLLRMDSVTQMDMLEKGKNYITPDEGRKWIDLPPTAGGNAVYRQQQDFSLAALAKRDAQDDPFGTSKPAPANDDEPSEDDIAQRSAFARVSMQKMLSKANAGAAVS